MNKILLCLLIMSVISCRQAQVIEVTRDVEVQDTLIVTKPDTASLHSLLECDSLGNLLVREIEMLQGERTRVNTVVNYRTRKVAEVRTEFVTQTDTIYIPMYRERVVRTQTIATNERRYRWYLWLLIGVFVGCLTTFRIIK